ncbi:hypothetical protein HanIR_Chr06g0257461 [Helianthus annuus]|nr:hypothetical protein HanIR_Chr06g0257461 [Helianthus annuus]
MQPVFWGMTFSVIYVHVRTIKQGEYVVRDEKTGTFYTYIWNTYTFYRLYSFIIYKQYYSTKCTKCAKD